MLSYVSQIHKFHLLWIQISSLSQVALEKKNQRSEILNIVKENT